MLYRLALLLLFVPAVSVPAITQSGIHPSPGSVELHVKLMYQNDHSMPKGLQVLLLSQNGETIYENYSDESGEAIFSVMPDRYSLEVTGDAVDTLITPAFNVFRGEIIHTELLHVRLKDDIGAKTGSDGPIVASAADKIPQTALDRFTRGTDLLTAGDLERARILLEEAIKIYPQYSGALSNLGLIALRQGDPAKARMLFQQAVDIDPTLSIATINLCKLLLRSSEYNNAQQLLARASALHPLDPDLLMLLAESQLLNRDFDKALATARKVSEVSDQEQYSMAHVIAGSALQQKLLYKEAIAEYQKFLAIDPLHPTAPRVRATIRALSQRSQIR